MARNKHHTSSGRPLSSSVIADILSNNPKRDVDEAVSPNTPRLPEPITFCRPVDLGEDFLPEESLSDFVKFCNSVISRYEENERLESECDAQTQDILHKIELGDDLGVVDGYKIYKLLRNVRRKRRQCKNQNDYYRPTYEYCVANRQVFNQLSQVQGRTKTIKSGIQSRQYTTRTSILDEMLPVDEREQIEEICDEHEE